MNNFGFIITRHVNSEKTNIYWNHSLKLIRKFYPNVKIVIIDDNSNQNFVKADYPYNNIMIIQSSTLKNHDNLKYKYNEFIPKSIKFQNILVSVTTPS